MANLDLKNLYPAYDPENLAGFILDFPNQLEKAWQECGKIKIPPDFKDVSKIVLLGMGGSGIGGEIVTSLSQSKIKQSVISVKDYELPAFVDQNTLVFATSYSGKTEETISALKKAIEYKAKIFAITKNGEIETIASQNKIPLYKFNYSSPPRQALGLTLMPILAVLIKLEFLKIPEKQIKEAIMLTAALQEKFSPSSPHEENLAKQAAQKIVGKTPIIIAAGPFAATATRFANQINENAKNIAFSAPLPEMNHNLIEGLSFPEKITEKIFFVLLRSPEDHPRISKRFDIIKKFFDEAKIGYFETRLQGKNLLSQIFYAITFGDWTSYFLAILNKTRPSPNPAIDFLKEELRK